MNTEGIQILELGARKSFFTRVVLKAADFLPFSKAKPEVFTAKTPIQSWDKYSNKSNKPLSTRRRLFLWFINSKKYCILDRCFANVFDQIMRNFRSFTSDSHSCLAPCFILSFQIFVFDHFAGYAVLRKKKKKTDSS